jgi:hypothetical protein
MVISRGSHGCDDRCPYRLAYGSQWRIAVQVSSSLRSCAISSRRFWLPSPTENHGVSAEGVEIPLTSDKHTRTGYFGFSAYPHDELLKKHLSR